MSIGQSTTPSVDRASEKRFIAEGLRRVEALERQKPSGFWVGEFISNQRAVTDLQQNGDSSDGTTTGTGEVEFDAGTQITNIGGVVVGNTPPVDLQGVALSFDTAAPTFISLDVPGWYYIQRGWSINEPAGLSPFWFELSGDPSPLEIGAGGNWTWVRGKFNQFACERSHLLYIDEVTEIFPYLVNSPIAHEGVTHDGVFWISVVFIVAP